MVPRYCSSLGMNSIFFGGFMEKIVKNFYSYVNSYQHLGIAIIRKIEHSVRVMKLCEELAKKLDFHEEEIQLCMIVGLLHDIGRFEQWKRYQTYVDNQSIDHGDLGAELLEDEAFMRKFNSNKNWDFIIRKAVKYHNKYHLPDFSNDLEEKVCKIVRDADKIDIMYLFASGEIEMNIKEEKISPKVEEEIHRRCLVSLKNRKNSVDKIVAILAFIFDVEYQESMKIIIDKHYISKIIAKIEACGFKALNNQVEEINHIIDSYIKERMSC